MYPVHIAFINFSLRLASSIRQICDHEVADLSEEEMHETPNIFWIEYTNFNNNIDPIDINKYIWRSKDIHGSNGNLCH